MEKLIIEDTNGVSREAEIITTLSIEDRKYVIYSINGNNNTSVVCASRIIKDENNNDKLIDIEEGLDKDKIKRFIETLSK